jgi:hypothetical protein
MRGITRENTQIVNVDVVTYPGALQDEPPLLVLAFLSKPEDPRPTTITKEDRITKTRNISHTMLTRLLAEVE